MKRFCIKAIAAFLLISSSCTPYGFTKLDNNVLVHDNSSVKFPSQICRANRLKPYYYGSDNFSIGYQLANETCFVTFTVYVYKTLGVAFEDEYVKGKEAIELYYEETLKEENEFSIYQFNDSIFGKMAVYDLVQYAYGEPHFRTSYLYLFAYGDWFVKYRITHSNAYFVCANDAIKTFIEDFKWN